MKQDLLISNLFIFLLCGFNNLLPRYKNQADIYIYCISCYWLLVVIVTQQASREILAPNLYLQINIVATFRDVRLEVSG